MSRAFNDVIKDGCTAYEKIAKRKGRIILPQNIKDGDLVRFGVGFKVVTQNIYRVVGDCYPLCLCRNWDELHLPDNLEIRISRMMAKGIVFRRIARRGDYAANDIK